MIEEYGNTFIEMVQWVVNNGIITMDETKY